jgi:DNA modification methylase
VIEKDLESLIADESYVDVPFVLEPNSIYQGDVLEVLQKMPSSCIQTVITSPPYWGLRDYGVDGQLGNEKTIDEYVSKMVLIFREVRRVLKDDGTLWLNLGDNFFKNKQLVGMPWRVAFALQEDGWILRSDIVWSKLNPMPESVRDRPTRSHEYIFLFSKKAKGYYYDHEAIKEPIAESSMKRIQQKSFDTQTGGDKDYKNGTNKNRSIRRALESFKTKHDLVGVGRYKDVNRDEARFMASGLRNKRTVWTFATKPYKEAHFAVFPDTLVTPCLLAGSKEGDLVMDPFFGSGTTGEVALKYHREFIGIELNPTYIEIAKRRLGIE